MTNLRAADESHSGAQGPTRTGEQYPDKETVVASENKLVAGLDKGGESRKEDFWNVNVPVSEQTEECPEFLRYAFENEKDRGILSTPDDQYRRQTWQDVQQLIRDNRLDLFMRVPSELRLYREYCAKLIQDYGSIMKFVMQERLRWEDMASSAPPFSNSSMLTLWLP